MHISLTPALKGFITGLAMTGTMLVTFNLLPGNSPLHYASHLIYTAGLTWTLLSYRYSADFTGKFWDSFNRGFRSFVIITLVMVAFTFILNKLHPEFAEESARLYKEQLVKESTSQTPAEIEQSVSSYKNGYVTFMLYRTIFGYLIFGAVVTTSLTLLINRRK